MAQTKKVRGDAPQIFKDSKGRTMGKAIATTNGKIQVYDLKGSYLGWYDAVENCTYKKNGSKVGTGNMLPILFTF